MRQLITDYTFDAGARTVTSPAFTSLEVILIITNLTSNRMIYNFASNGKGGSLEDTTLTLGYDTSGMADDDVLQIYCEAPDKVDENGFPQVSLATRLAGEDPVYDAIHTLGTPLEFVGQQSQQSQEVVAAHGVFSAGFARCSIIVSGTWTGSLTVQSGGGDGQYFNKPVSNDASANALSTATITTNGIYYCDINADVLRVYSTTLSSGTVTVKFVFTSAPGGRATMGVVATQSGTWNVGPVIAGSAARTSVASSISTVTLLASNTNRKLAFFYNDSSASLYIACGAAAASATSFTVKVAPGGFFELPTPPIYSGIVTGFWDSANGNVRVTEVT